MSEKTEHWYLDLDGVRSGPYETSEIEELFKAGELLPQHKISESISKPKWLSVVEWRLLKTFQEAHEAPKTEKKDEIHFSKAELPAMEEIKIEFQEPKVESKPLPVEEHTGQIKIELIAEPVKPPPIFKPADSSPQVAPVPVPPTNSISPHPSAVSIPTPVQVPPVVTEVKKEESKQVEFTARPEIKKEPESEPKSGSEKLTIQADPTAELFELFQTARNKRDRTIQAPPNVSNQNSPTPSEKDEGGFSANKKLIAMGISAVFALGLLGYGLGKLFSGSDHQPIVEEKANPEAKKMDAVAPSAPVSPKIVRKDPPPARPTEEVVDRSNNQMTIRSKINKGNAFRPSLKPKAEESEPELSEEEIKELKELRKELEELKNLRANDLIEEEPDMVDENMGNPAAGPEGNPEDPNLNPNGDPGY